MRKTLIKICGVRTIEHAEVAVEAGADMIGLVFVDNSPRCVDVETAKRIADHVGSRAVKVGLFVDEPCDRILEIAQVVGLDAAQLHGRESPDAIPALSPLNVIKAIHAGDDATPWGAAMAVLVDTPPPPGVAGAPAGGSGQTFDWSVLDGLDRDALPPLMLAGGLTPANVAAAIERVEPWAVDVSSGVESSRGVKDAGLIRAFCATVRG